MKVFYKKISQKYTKTLKQYHVNKIIKQLQYDSVMPANKIKHINKMITGFCKNEYDKQLLYLNMVLSFNYNIFLNYFKVTNENFIKIDLFLLLSSMEQFLKKRLNISKTKRLSGTIQLIYDDLNLANFLFRNWSQKKIQFYLDTEVLSSTFQQRALEESFKGIVFRIRTLAKTSDKKINLNAFTIYENNNDDTFIKSVTDFLNIAINKINLQTKIKQASNSQVRCSNNNTSINKNKYL